MPQNPYLTPPPGAPPAPGGMDPAKMQRQQARTDRQNQRTATQQMGQQVQTAMGQLPAQPVPQVASDAMQGYEQMNQTAQAMPQAVQQANLMQTHFPGGPPQQAPMQTANIPDVQGYRSAFQPKQMLGQVQGMQRAKAMESMARPSAVRGAFKAAQQTGAVPGVKPPKPPQY